MADKQFDLSPEQKKLFLQRAQRRQELRTEFLKIKHNPFQGLAGGVSDPAYLRYQAMGVSVYEHFRPTLYNGLRAFCVVILPIIGFSYIIKKSRNEKEAMYRRGEVSYRDRLFKFQI